MMKYETLDHNKETIILTIIRSNTYTTLVFINNTTNIREISLALENRKTMLILQQSQIFGSLEFGPSLKKNY